MSSPLVCMFPYAAYYIKKRIVLEQKGQLTGLKLVVSE